MRVLPGEAGVGVPLSPGRVAPRTELTSSSADPQSPGTATPAAGFVASAAKLLEIKKGSKREVYADTCHRGNALGLVFLSAQGCSASPRAPAGAAVAQHLSRRV